MESNKENYGRLKQTRIPQPLQPLPPLPKHLVDMKKEEKLERPPLKTLNTQSGNVMSLAGPSKRIINANKFRKPFKDLDTKHVTQRKIDEELDGNLMFHDNKGNSSVILISDDDDKDVNCDNVIDMSAVTPIQRHSPIKQKKIDEKFRRRHNFNESLQERLQSPDLFSKITTRSLVRNYGTDIFVHLMSVESSVVESKPPEVPRIPSNSRACVLNWLMKINGPDGNPAVLQSACWYLDSVLATSQIEIKKLQLVAAACYWISQKLYGPAMSAEKLVHYSGHAFTSEGLLTAEKAILQKLEFPPQPVVPQDFITYLSWWCDQDHPGEIEIAATFLCLSGMMVDKNLCLVPASVIGAAAVKNALVLLKKEDCMSRLNMCTEYKAAERKAINIALVQSVQREAVRTVASFNYEYKTPLEHYGTPPQLIAERIVSASNELAFMARNIARNPRFY